MNGYFEDVRFDKMGARGLHNMSKLRVPMCEEAIKRINRVVKLVGSQRKLAAIVGVKNTTVHFWCTNQKTPLSPQILSLEVLTAGYIDHGLILYGTPPSSTILVEKTLHYNFQEFIIANHVKNKEELAYYPLNIQQIMKSNVIYDKDMHKLKSYFGRDIEYWLCVKNIFNNKMGNLLEFA